MFEGIILPTRLRDDPEFFYVVKEVARDFKIEKKFLYEGLMKTRGYNVFLLSSQHIDRYFFSADLPRRELVGTNALKYIEYGEKQGLNKRNTFANKPEWYRFGVRSPAELVAPCGLGATFYCAINEANAISSNSYTEVRLKSSKDQLPLWAMLNSVVFWLQLELIGRSSLGGGMLKVDPIEYRQALVLTNKCLERYGRVIKKALNILSERNVKSIFDEVIEPDRQVLDNIAFEILGFTQGEQDAVYEELINLVEARLKKAGSV